MAKKKRKQPYHNPALNKKRDTAVVSNPFHIVTDWYLMAVLAIYPLIVGLGDYGYRDILDVKAYFWLGLTGLWAFALLFLVLRAFVRKEPIPFHIGWPQYLVIAFLLWYVFTGVLSERPFDSFFTINGNNTNSVVVVVSYGIAFLGISLFGEIKRRHVIAAGISAGICGLTAILQAFGLNPFGLYPPGYGDAYAAFNGAFLGTIGNIDVLAEYLCFVVPLLVVYALRSKQKLDRLLLVPAIICIVALFRSGVDAGILALLGCVVLCLPVVLRNRKLAKISGVSCLVAVPLGLLLLWFWPGESGMFYEASQLLHGNVSPLFGTGRIGIWTDALRFAGMNPIIGNGPASASWLYESSRNVNMLTGNVFTAGNAHSTYLGYLVEGGIPALVLYVAITAMSLYGWFKRRNDDVSAAVGSGVLACLIEGVFGVSMVSSAAFVWLGMGCVVPEVAPQKEPAKKPVFRFSYAVVAALAVICITGCVKYATKPEPLEGLVIGIDPGHQASAVTAVDLSVDDFSDDTESGGATGIVTGRPEHEVNLEIALQLKEKLEDLGAKTVMTRETADVEISNAERADLFNDANVDLGLRIHCNGSENPEDKGVWMIARETGNKTGECVEAATDLRDAVTEATGRDDVKMFLSDEYEMNNRCSVPCVLIECGYMTNKEDDVLLSDSAYQEQLVDGIVNGIYEFTGR